MRRQILAALGSGLLLPCAAFAQQQGKIWRVGFLAQRQIVLSESDVYYGSFRRAMRELGYVEGKNLIIEWRSAEGNAERLPDLAAELVRMNVDVIVATATPAALAAQKATSTIPIIMSAGDPVGNGLVKDLARPGGNITGFSTLSIDLYSKYLELLRDIVPKFTSVAVLTNPLSAATPLLMSTIHAVSRKFGVKAFNADAGKREQIAAAIATISRQRPRALIITRDPLFVQQSVEIAELSLRHKLPSIGGIADYAEAGGLMSYGQYAEEIWYRAANYVDRIFKGARPGDLPIERPAKFEFMINAKTAKALGLKIPQSILVQATKVIE